MRSRDDYSPSGAARGCRRSYPCRRQPRLLASGYPNPLGTSSICADALCLKSTRLDTIVATRATCSTLQEPSGADADPDGERTLTVRGAARVGHDGGPGRPRARARDGRTRLMQAKSPVRFRGQVRVEGGVGIGSPAALRGAKTASSPARLDVAARRGARRPSAPGAYCRGITWEEGTVQTWVRAGPAEPCFVETLVADEGRLALQSLAGPGRFLLRRALNEYTWCDWIVVDSAPRQGDSESGVLVA